MRKNKYFFLGLTALYLGLFIGQLLVNTHAGAYGFGHPTGFNIINGPIKMNFFANS